jgi:hypothetical protein
MELIYFLSILYVTLQTVRLRRGFKHVLNLHFSYCVFYFIRVLVVSAVCMLISLPCLVHKACCQRRWYGCMMTVAMYYVACGVLLLSVFFVLSLSVCGHVINAYNFVFRLAIKRFIF